MYKISFLRKMGDWRWNKKRKRKEGFLTALATAIKKGPTRKPANELKVQEKTVRTTIKLDLSPDLNPLDFAIWDVLETKSNATFHPNIGLLTPAIEEEWNKMSEEFILKACKSSRRRVDTIVFKKWRSYWVNLLFSVHLLIL